MPPYDVGKRIRSRSRSEEFVRWHALVRPEVRGSLKIQDLPSEAGFVGIGSVMGSESRCQG